LDSLRKYYLCISNGFHEAVVSFFDRGEATAGDFKLVAQYFNNEFTTDVTREGT
jgi:hypothetical protein